MGSPRVARFLVAAVATSLPACGLFPSPGYSASNPGQVVCGCHDGDACYEAAAQLASTNGETDADGEELMYLAQCACFQGSVGGCNTLGHFAKDYVAACAQDQDVAKSCALAGLVHYHGVQVPRGNGRSFDRDPTAAKAELEKACRAGSRVACSYASR
jgi:TPR repeat protein